MAIFVVSFVGAGVERPTERVEAERFVTDEGFVTFYDTEGRDVRRFSADMVFSVRRVKGGSEQ